MSYFGSYFFGPRYFGPSYFGSVEGAIATDVDHLFLIIVQAHDGSTLQTFYLSSDSFRSAPTDDPPNQPFDSRIQDPGSIERRIGVLESSSESIGDVVVVSGDPGNGQTLDNWLAYGFGNRDITILAVPQGAVSITGNSVTVFVGSVRTLKASNPLERFELEIADRLAVLDLPFLNERFAGTVVASAASAEGNADLEGQIKQRIYGEAFNVLLQPANPFDLIYLASNSAVESIAVYDGGVLLDDDGDVANINALHAASISPGHYLTCLALGLVRLGGTPQFAVTADVVEGDGRTGELPIFDEVDDNLLDEDGEFILDTGNSDRSGASIAYRMLIDFGIDEDRLNLESFTLLGTLNSATCYALIDDDRTALVAVQQVLQSIGGWLLPDRLGRFEVGLLSAPAPASMELTF